MARTLTASSAKPPQPRQRDADCADVVAGLWITLGDLWRLGRQYGEVQTNLRKVSKRLADPRLADHPLRPGYVVKVEVWRLELRDFDRKAEDKRRAFARQWDGLPERIHTFLRDSGGWPEESEANTGQEVANALWKMAIEDKPYVGGECGF